MFCRNCGNKIPNDAIFCNSCGARQTITGISPDSPGESISHSPQTIQLASETPQTPASGQTEVAYQPVIAEQAGQQTITSSSTGQTGPFPAYQVSPPYSTPPPIPTSQPVQAALPPNVVQQLLVRIFQPKLATNMLFGITLGGLLAALLGAFATYLFITIAHAILPHITAGTSINNEELEDYILGIYALHSPFRNSLELFLVALGAGEHGQFTFSGSGSTNTFFSPVNGLLIIPALFLTLGGYVAACTEYQGNIRGNLLRGAAIAIPFMLILLLLMTQVNGCIPLQNGTDPNSPYTCTGSYTGTLTIDIPTVLLFGLLWGALFGVLGASLKLGRGNWAMMIRYFLRITRRPQLTGMITGGLVATGIGFALSLLFIYGILAYTEYSLPLFATRFCYGGGEDWQFLTSWGIAQGPLHAINLFLFSQGAPITISNSAQAGQTCFYTAASHLSVTWRDSSLHLHSWVYATLALPVISLFLGGRVSVAISRVQGIGAAAVQGALIAVPFTILMLVCSLLSTISITSTFLDPNATSSTAATQSAGASLADLILWALLSSAVLGAIGGIYQASPLKLSIGKVVSMLFLPVKWLASPINALLKGVGQNRTLPPRTSHIWLNATVFVTLVLTLCVVGAGILFTVLSQTLSIDAIHRTTDILSVILVVLPGLLLICAAATALGGFSAHTQQAPISPQPQRSM